MSLIACVEEEAIFGRDVAGEKMSINGWVVARS
jgi:hypothetical protein